MDNLAHFSIPIKGLGTGVHHFDYPIDGAFFKSFEGSPIQEATLQLAVTLDKRPDFYTFEFSFSGTVPSECDRCLASIQLPVEGTAELIAKIGENSGNDEPEVIYLEPEVAKLNIAPYVYECIILALPMVKVYDCEDDSPKPCNTEMLTYLESAPKIEQEENPIWDELKKLTGNN